MDSGLYRLTSIFAAPPIVQALPSLETVKPFSCNVDVSSNHQPDCNRLVHSREGDAQLLKTKESIRYD